MTEIAKTSTMMGGLLKEVHNARYFSSKEATEALWERNGLSNPASRNGYKLAETKTLHRDGTEITEYRLYRLIDSSTVTISTKVTTTVEEGVKSGS